MRFLLLLLLALKATAADVFVGQLPQTNRAPANSFVVLEIPGLGTNSTQLINPTNLMLNPTGLGGVSILSSNDNLSAAITGLPNNSMIIIGHGNWTNRPSLYYSNTALGDFYLINKTNVTIKAIGHATLWNTNVGDGLVLSNCSDITIEGLRFYGWRQTNYTYAGQSQIVVSRSRNIKITDCRFDNSLDFSIAERDDLTGSMVQSTNVEVSYCTFFNCGSWWGNGGINYDGSCVMPSSYWNIHHNMAQECVYFVELFGPAALMCSGNRIENNYILNCINSAIWDGGMTNNSDHIIRNNQIVYNDAFRTVSSNTVSGMNAMQFTVARRYLIEGNTFDGPWETFNSGSSAIYFIGGASVFETFDVIVRNNTITNVPKAMLFQNTAGGNSIRGIRISGNLISRTSSEGIRLAASECVIDGNTFIDCTVSDNSAGSIWIAPFSLGATNNLCTGNIFRSSAGNTPLSPAIRVESTAINTRLDNNEISSVFSPPIVDSSTSTRLTEPSDLKLFTISGAGNGNTNYTLLATRANMIMGSSNINIAAVMNYQSGSVRPWTTTITNLSAITWGVTFSPVTNNWKFWGNQGGGTNAPTVLTNNTRLILHGQSEGTNILVSYEYFRPAL